MTTPQESTILDLVEVLRKWSALPPVGDRKEVPDGVLNQYRSVLAQLNAVAFRLLAFRPAEASADVLELRLELHDYLVDEMGFECIQYKNISDCVQTGTTLSTAASDYLKVITPPLQLVAAGDN